MRANEGGREERKSFVAEQTLKKEQEDMYVYSCSIGRDQRENRGRTRLSFESRAYKIILFWW